MLFIVFMCGFIVWGVVARNHKMQPLLAGLIFFISSLYAEDSYQRLILYTAIANMFLAARGGFKHYALLFLSILGTLVFAGADNWLKLFLSLELLSIPLYAICADKSIFSIEAALKYFILGSFSSAILAYGVAIFYLDTGSLVLGQLTQATSFLAYFFIGIGLFFKLTLIPFHFWAIDTYQGAPSVVTSYLATSVKVAVIAVLVKVFPKGDLWLALIVALTLIAANLMALKQNNFKRLLAYSSISHAGFLALAIYSAASQEIIIYYLLIYSAATIGTFAFTQELELTSFDSIKSTEIINLASSLKKEPYSATILAIFLISLAGLPPAIGGLLAKITVIYAAMSAQAFTLAIIAVIAVLISCGYYLRVIMQIFFLTKTKNATQTELLLPSYYKLFLFCLACVVCCPMFLAI